MGLLDRTRQQAHFLMRGRSRKTAPTELVPLNHSWSCGSIVPTNANASAIMSFTSMFKRREGTPCSMLLPKASSGSCGKIRHHALSTNRTEGDLIHVVLQPSLQEQVRLCASSLLMSSTAWRAAFLFPPTASK